MSKELEALEHIYYGSQEYGETDKYYKYLKNYFESIDNAKPSEALRELENLGTHGIEYREPFELGFTKSMPFKSTKEFKIIKQALLKAQEQEKVLEIIKEKRIDLQLIRIADNVEWYNKEYIYRHEIEYLNRDEVLTYQISQEEFDLLKRWLG